MPLPKKPRPPIAKSITSLLVYGTFKCGKSAIMAGLTRQYPGKSIIISTEPGYERLTATVEEVRNPKQFIDTVEEIKKDGSFDYVVVDTITELDTWSEIWGTYDFMGRIQGKTWNRDEMGNMIRHNDKNFQSVHELGKGYGYRYSRDVMKSWLKELIECTKTVILVAHVRDKFVTSQSGDTTQSIDIALTGKVRDIYCARVDGIAIMTRKGTEGYLNFNASDDAKWMGSRDPSLQGLVKISDFNPETEELTTYWSNIFKTDN